MFAHGRECYRRNSFVILYSFYKNMLYVIVNFIFGYLSLFSGQILYEKYIYQTYNICMTAVPIMWYAIYDFEYERGSTSDDKDN